MNSTPSTVHNFSVTYSAEDGEWIAKTDRFRYVSWLDGSPTEAISGLIEVLKDIGHWDNRVQEEME